MHKQNNHKKSHENNNLLCNTEYWKSSSWNTIFVIVSCQSKKKSQKDAAYIFGHQT